MTNLENCTENTKIKGWRSLHAHQISWADLNTLMKIDYRLCCIAIMVFYYTHTHRISTTNPFICFTLFLFLVEFFVSKMIKVNGMETHPLFNFLVQFSRCFSGNSIKWNFTKFLCGVDGSVQRFPTKCTPMEMEKYVVAELQKIQKS